MRFLCGTACLLPRLDTMSDFLEGGIPSAANIIIWIIISIEKIQIYVEITERELL